MRTFNTIIAKNGRRLRGLRSIICACGLALAAVLPTIVSAQQQQQTGLQPYYRRTNPNGQGPPGNGWSPLPPAGAPVTLQPGKSVWIGFDNSEKPDQSKTFQALVYVGLGVTGYTSCTATGVKGDGTTSTATIDIKPYFYWWVVKATFTPQPAWEYIRIKNTSSDPVTIPTLRMDRVSSWCKKTERSGGSENGQEPRITFGDASFGAQGAMFNNTRITGIEVFPRNVRIDRNEAPSFSAPPGTGNWSQEFVEVDPDDEPRPLGGVRFASDGAGLEAGQEFDMALSMIECADTVYDIFAFDADAGAYQRIYVNEEGPPWWENFDDDPAEIGLHGRRGWKGWDNRPLFDAFVSEAQSRSPLNSVDIQGRADLVREFEGANEGRWSFSAWQYIPTDYVSGGTGRFQGSHFLLLNTYNDGGPYHWSVDLQMHSASQSIKVYHGAGRDTIDIPYETDRWVKIEVIIDLDDDWTRIYYDDNLITEYPWTGGIFGEGGGALDVAALDLWANGSTPIYYDDFQLVRVPESRVPADWLDIQVLEGELIGGGLAEIAHSDDAYLETEARVTGEAHQPHLLVMQLGGIAPLEAPGLLHATIESRISDVEASTWLSLRDWDTGEIVIVDQFTVGLTESVHEVTLPADRLYVRPGDRRIELEIKQVNFLPFTLSGYHSLFDQIKVSME